MRDREGFRPSPSTAWMNWRRFPQDGILRREQTLEQIRAMATRCETFAAKLA